MAKDGMMNVDRSNVELLEEHVDILYSTFIIQFLVCIGFAPAGALIFPYYVARYII